jgi:hypothetical protein
MYCRGNPIKYSDPSGYAEYETRQSTAGGEGFTIPPYAYISKVYAGSPEAVLLLMGGGAVPAIEGVESQTLFRSFHGNDLRCAKPNYLYTLRDKVTNEIKKIGETINPEGRYSRKSLDEKNVYLQVEKEGTKTGIHQEQHEGILKYKDEHNGKRPDLNLNDW